MKGVADIVIKEREVKDPHFFAVKKKDKYKNLEYVLYVLIKRPLMKDKFLKYIVFFFFTLMLIFFILFLVVVAMFSFYAIYFIERLNLNLKRIMLFIKNEKDQTFEFKEFDNLQNTMKGKWEEINIIRQKYREHIKKQKDIIDSQKLELAEKNRKIAEYEDKLNFYKKLIIELEEKNKSKKEGEIK
jgi:hypothetical protein